MRIAAALLMTSLAAAPPDPRVLIVQAPDSPVRLDHAKILNAGDQPLVLLYAATNLTGGGLDQFTVMVFVFREGGLKARQVAPGRRELDANGTKFSTMVLDGFQIEPTDTLVVGVNQAQRVGSEQWWQAELQGAAEEAVKRQTR
jgi:hypothetical protein